jgi:3-(methylthio)propanoyl-CoA dehydrogenase
VAQYLRDSRVSPIYEGTNGIQGIDLVARKAPMRGGGVVADLLAQMDATGQQLAAAGPELAGMQPPLAAGVQALREATDWINSRGPAEPADALAGATPYLRLSGLVIGGWLMARSALAAYRLVHDASGPGAVFLRDKIGTARFYTGQLLPQAVGLLPAVTAGAGPLFGIDLSSAAGTASIIPGRLPGAPSPP